MSKPYTQSDLSDQFDEDLIWRRKELSDLKAAIRGADASARSALMRALVTMAYAHWEGYVKNAAIKYFRYFTMRKLPFSGYARQFYVNSYLARLDGLTRGRSGIEARCKIVNDILDHQEGRFSYINPSLIDTGSNLNADVMVEICRICDVNGAHFETKRTFIDQIVLKRRNAIAHGQQELIGESEIDELVAETLALMGHFRTLLENKIYTKGYLAA